MRESSPRRAAQVAPPISATSQRSGDARIASRYAANSAVSRSGTATAYCAILSPVRRRRRLGRGASALGAFHFSGGANMAQVQSKNRATSSEEARREVLDRCKTEGIESMLLWFTDLEGHLK